MDYATWRHVFKLDPAKTLPHEQLERLAESGTDAIIVGGSDDVTLENVLDLLAQIRRFSVPVMLEVSTIDAVTPGFDGYLIPTVLNTTEHQWITGLHHQALVEFGHLMNWQEVVMEGYCIMNIDCKAAQVTGVQRVPNEEDVVAYARMAENLFRIPIFYLEYSGIYGDPEIVAATANVLSKTQLFYGGGIQTAEQAAQMAQLADTVIVGNGIYNSFEAALSTVQAVKQTEKR